MKSKKKDLTKNSIKKIKSKKSLRNTKKKKKNY